MQEKKINPKDWILIVLLKRASEKYGINLSNFYNERKIPLEFKVKNSTAFFKIDDSLEKEGFLEKVGVQRENHRLTNEGKKKALKQEEKMSLETSFYIISKFPEIELKDRIERIESFIVSSIFLIFFHTLMSKVIEKNISFSPWIMALYLGVVFYLVLSLYKDFLTMTFLWTIRFQRSGLWKLKNIVWDNREKIMWVVIVITVVGIIHIVRTLNEDIGNQVVSGTVVAGILLLISNYEKIKEKLWCK